MKRVELPAFEGAKKLLSDVEKKIGTKNSSFQQIQSELEKKKHEATEARKVEQECLKEQEALIPLEQSARQKVEEHLSVMESEKRRGSVLQAILQAKESNDIQGSVLKAILQAKELNDIQGLWGSCANYDVAISTACGGFDYILGENELLC